MTATLSDLTRAFLDVILPPASIGKNGYLFIGVGLGGYWENGKYRHRDWDEKAFLWPPQADEVITAIEQWAPRGDVYICPYLMKTDSRAKGNAAWRQIVHCDADAGGRDAIRALGGFAIESGTPGHLQAYILLKFAVTQDQHEMLCEALARHLGGDPKIRDNDYLRPVGARNHKAAAPGAPTPGPVAFVVPLGTYPTDRVDPIELGVKLGVDLTNAAARQQPTATSTAQQDPIDLDAYQWVRDELAVDSGDRSEDTNRIVAACMQGGLSLEQTRWVVNQRVDLKERIDEFFARATPVDDVLEIWNKKQATIGWSLPGATGVGTPGAVPRPGPSTFFGGKGGLRAHDLATAVARTVICGYGDPDHRFYTYGGGVWTLEDGQIQAEAIALLGNRYRPGHLKIVTDIVRHLPSTERITDQPLSEYINVPNGMLRWETGELLAHLPDFRSTVQIPVEYVPGSSCPRFEKFLSEVLAPELFLPTVDGPGFIWELIGYTLYSGNPLHCAILLWGNGRNGKGTLIRVLQALLGEHNCSTVGLHQLLENRFKAATLYGKLANLAGDLDPKWLDNTATFKQITGGDAINAEAKFGTPFDFTPWALPFYSINKPFGSADSSEGWVARWVVVPFPHSFVGHEDHELTAKLTSEAELRGILYRSAAALPALMARGRFAELQPLTDARNAFIVASDAVRAWVNEQCELDPSVWTLRTELYRAYRNYANQDNPKMTLSAREFYNRIEQIAGVLKADHANGRGFRGIKLQGTPIHQMFNTP